MFLGSLKQRRKDLMQDIGKLQDKRSKLSEGRLKHLEKVAKELGGDKNYNLNINRTICPYYQRALNAEIEYKDDDDQPLGMNKGSIRGILTLLVIMTACLISIYLLFSPRIPVDVKFFVMSWFFGIASMVIGYYFISRISMNMGGNNLLF